MVDRVTARNEMTTMFWTDWQANTPAVNGGTVPTVKWDDVETPGNLPPTDAAWARFTVRHVTGAQRSLGATGNRIFEKQGIISCGVFAPKGQGLLLLDQLCQIVLDAFEGKSSPGGIWFRNGRIVEIGTDASWTRSDVIIDFIYDEQK